MERENKETYRKDFIEIVKKAGKLWASLSHDQTHPIEISNFAILEWQWDGELFANTVTGKRVVASKTMPAFYICR